MPQKYFEAIVTNSHQFIFPFFWPQRKPLLQLTYVAEGVLLVLSRILTVLIPIQLARVADILYKGNGMCFYLLLWLFLSVISQN
jgi:hypothetical protein